MFEKIINWFKGKPYNMNIPEKPKELKMYVLVRQDLDETYRCVQGAHAVCQYALNAVTYDIEPIDQCINNACLNLFKSWRNQTIVFLGVQNYQHLKQWQSTLNNLNVLSIPFHEPDLDNQLTAIACIHTGEIFSKLPVAG